MSHVTQFSRCLALLALSLHGRIGIDLWQTANLQVPPSPSIPGVTSSDLYT